MAIYRIQSKLFAGVFDPDTYNSMVNAAANNATPDAQRMLDGYSRKYAEDIAKYKNSTALTTIKPNTNIPTGKPNTNIPTGTNPPNKVGAWQSLKNTYKNAGTMGKAGMIGAGILGTGLMVKGAMDMMGGSSKKEAAFSEDGDSGMGTLGKIALGTAVIGGAGIVGGGLLAKAGKLGVSNQQRIGTGLAKIGNMVGSQALVNSGAKTVGKAAATRAARSYNVPLSREGARIIKSSYGEGARDVFKNIAKQRVAAKQGILDKYSLPTQNAFSEDTGSALREAAIYGTVGTGILGAGYLAKKGMLGKTAKNTYESASKKVRAIWSETKKPEIKVDKTQTQTVRVKKKGKSGTTSTTERITQESGKPDRVTVETTARKVKFAPEDWSKVLKVIKEKGMDPSNPAHKLAAAKIAGVKPVSVK